MYVLTSIYLIQWGDDWARDRPVVRESTLVALNEDLVEALSSDSELPGSRDVDGLSHQDGPLDYPHRLSTSRVGYSPSPSFVILPSEREF